MIRAMLTSPPPAQLGPAAGPPGPAAFSEVAAGRAVHGAAVGPWKSSRKSGQWAAWVSCMHLLVQKSNSENVQEGMNGMGEHRSTE